MGRFLWERERPARKSAGKMPVCAPGWAHSLRRAVRGGDDGKTDGCAGNAPGATRDVDGEKPDGGDGRGAGAINRAPTGCVATVCSKFISP